MPFSAFKSLIDLLIRLLEMREARGRRLFEDHVSPVHSEIRKVYEDYVSINESLLNVFDAGPIARILRGTDDLREVIAVLKKDRQRMAGMRQEIGIYCDELMKKYPPSKENHFFIWYDGGNIDTGIGVFAHSCLKLIHSNPADAGPSHTTMTSLLDELQDALDTRSATEARKYFLEELTSSRRFIDSSWNSIVEVHAQLRVECLR